MKKRRGIESASAERFGIKPHLIEELHSEKVEPLVVKRPVGSGPSDRITPDRPHLGHSASNLGRQPPALNKGPDPVGTHNVNQEMIAEAYRSGLRIGIGRSIKRKSLGFLFGS